MFGIHDLALFIVSGLLLNMVPGPDALLVVSRSASQGWRAGSAAALGIGAGTFVHVFAAALGLSALLAASAAGFTLVKLVGAAYLVYVGIGLLFARAAKSSAADLPASVKTPPLRWQALFAQGFWTNALNPKVALFFLAFVPQFIDPASPDKALAFVLLGCIFNFNSLLFSHALAVFAAAAGRRLQLGGRVTRWLNRLVGGAFIAFGLRLALTSSRS